MTDKERGIDLLVYAASGLALGLGRKTFVQGFTSLALLVGGNFPFEVIEALGGLCVAALMGIGWYFFRNVPEEQGLFRVLVFGLAAAAGTLLVP